MLAETGQSVLLCQREIAMENVYKSLYVMCEEGASSYVRPVLEGINEVLCLAGVQRHIPVHNFGVWRHIGYLDQENSLTEFNSVDWYVAVGLHESRNGHQLNAETLIRLLAVEPWQQAQKHYDVMVVQHDLYDGDTQFIIGAGVENFGAVISVHRFLGIPDSTLRLECVKSATIHEVGHIFGLIPDNRTYAVEESLGKHCTNRCIMRQGLRVPHDWIRLTQDRLSSANPFCSTCQDDLLNYFGK